jgi:Ca2+-binding RTX toxin-like protein
MSDIFPYLAVGYGDEGDDRLNGSATTSTLAGGAGADIVYGYDGNDLLFSAGPAEGLNPNAPVVGPIAGEADSGTERDQLFGGAGDDRLSIGYGDDADGGAGTNSLALSLRGAASGVTFATPDIASGAAFSLGGGTIQNVQSIVVLWGSSFADTLTLGAQSSGVTVFGEGGNDTINTPGAADTIRGGAGADIIDAGGGDDTIHYDAADEAASGEQVDGGSGVDTVQTAAQIVVDLTGATFTRIERLVALGGAIISTTTLNGIGSLGGSFTLANGGAVSIGSGTAIGNLFFTLSAAGNQIDLGGVDLPYGLIRVYGKGGEDIITASPAIGGDYHGGGGNDVLIGGSSSDHLYGNEGNDRLDGRGSGDWMTGGTGDDLYIFDNFNDRAVENDGEGNDTIESSVTIWEGYAVNVETLKLTGTAAIGATGDHRANTLIGNVAGNMLDGGGGADTMIGGLGNDIYYVDEPADSVQENPGEGTDEIRTDLGSYSLATLANVENLTGASEFGQTLTGNSGANRILGSQGADTLNGSAGDDFLEGRGAGDALVGGTGDDIYSFVDAEDVATEQADEGIDEIRTTLGTYVLAANFEKLTAVGAGARDFRGNMAGNVVTGGSGNDTLRLHDGGGDGTSGLAGNDIFFFGGALDNWDRIDGGAGTDTLVLQGNYAGFIMAPEVLAGIEGISLQGGSVTRWGQAGTSSYDYGLTLANAATAPGVQLRINGQSLQTGEDFAFDGSAETDGRFLLYAGFGIDTFTGGSGNDVFFFEAGRFGAGDRIVGGGGSDAVVISGAPDGVAGPAQVAIAAGALNGVESLSFNGRFASDPAARPSYSAVMQDGNLGGGTLIVNASSLAIGQSLSFDGSAVADGRLRIFGGADGDTLRGGAGDDVIEGGGLGDAITGGGGMDVFVYRNVSDSAGAARDVIHGFHFGNDKIDLSLIDANANADGNQAFAWIGTEAFSGAAGQLRAGFDSDMNMWAVQGDVDGDGNADFQLYVATGAGPPPEADFVF